MAGRQLGFRDLFRRFGKGEQADLAAAIRRATPKLHPDGQPTGGSLATQISAARVLRIRKWGYVVRMAALGQKLTWFVRGKTGRTTRVASGPKAGQFSAHRGSPAARGASFVGQQPRPLNVKFDIPKFTKALEKDAARQVRAIDKRARA